MTSDEGTIGPAGLHAVIQLLARECDEARTELAHWRGCAQDVGEADGHGWVLTTNTLRDEVARLTRERDRLRLIVMETAAQGCVFDWRPVVCTHSSTSRDHWCLPCRARAALEDK